MFTAFLDACVLLPVSLADTLASLPQSATLTPTPSAD